MVFDGYGEYHKVVSIMFEGERREGGDEKGKMWEQ
jgi:hypothetical protein